MDSQPGARSRPEDRDAADRRSASEQVSRQVEGQERAEELVAGLADEQDPPVSGAPADQRTSRDQLSAMTSPHRPDQIDAMAEDELAGTDRNDTDGESARPGE